MKMKLKLRLKRIEEYIDYVSPEDGGTIQSYLGPKICKEIEDMSNEEFERNIHTFAYIMYMKRSRK